MSKPIDKTELLADIQHQTGAIAKMLRENMDRGVPDAVEPTRIWAALFSVQHALDQLAVVVLADRPKRASGSGKLRVVK